MKISIIVVCTALVSSGIIFIPNAFAENVPSWIKNNAGWWADGQIDDGSFVSGIQWLISNDVMIIPPTEHGVGDGNDVIPSWIKNNAGWWAGGQIDDGTFISGIQWLISNGIITLEDECIFQGEKYVHLTKQARFVLCNPDIDLDYIHTWIKPDDSDELKLNSEGFRGPEFSKQKPDNTYRIIAIGGSTTWGDGVTDDNMWTTNLQKKFEQTNLEINVEVINAGISGGWSKPETILIKERMIDYEPDLFLVYDGWNDQKGQLYATDTSYGNEIDWKNRWIEVCNLGKSLGFDTIITVQPLLGTGTNNFPDSNQEVIILNERWFVHEPILRNYPNYIKQLPELEKHCTDTADLTSIFDLPDAFFMDTGHVDAKGNQIVADHMYELALPVIIEKYGLASDSIQVIADEKPTSKAKQDVPSSLDFRGKHLQGNDFSGQNLSGATFLYSTLDNVDFSNANLQDTNFRFANIDNTNCHLANLKNVELSRTAISNSDLSNADLSGASLVYANLRDIDMSGAVLKNADLRGSLSKYLTLDDTNFEDADFSFSEHYFSDFTKTNLTNTILHDTAIDSSNLNNIDFTTTKFMSANEFTGSEMRGTTLPKNIFNTDFTIKFFPEFYIRGADLRGVDLTNIDLTDAMFSLFDESTFSQGIVSELYDFRERAATDLSVADLSGANLSGKNLSLVIFQDTIFKNADLSNSDLRFSDLRRADLTGADLSGANLEFAQLDDAILDDTILKCINHPICQMP
jgi:uncharacterized protein YjbI with pentapeptide repeats/lysophospholipase L1-like esterase